VCKRDSKQMEKHMIIDLQNTSVMAPDERLLEVAAILAIGYRKFRKSMTKPVVSPTDVPENRPLTRESSGFPGPPEASSSSNLTELENAS